MLEFLLVVMGIEALIKPMNIGNTVSTLYLEADPVGRWLGKFVVCLG